MRPFDLEKALAGEPVVTRDGRTVTEIHHFKTMRSDCEFSLFAVVDGDVKSYLPDGRWSSSGGNSPRDLFMAPVKRQAWTNVFETPSGAIFTSGGCYDSNEKAEKAIMGAEHYVKTMLIHEWEE